MNWCQGFCTKCGTGCAQHSEYTRNWKARYEEEVGRTEQLRSQLVGLEQRGARDIQSMMNLEAANGGLQKEVERLRTALQSIAELGRYCCDIEGLGHECEPWQIATAALVPTNEGT